MKQMILIIIVLALSGCSNNNIKVETITTLNPTIEPSGTSIITPTSTLNPTITPTSNSSNKGVNISESDALTLIKSKLDEESLRVSSLGIGGIDDNGNYIITQSSKATTVVMEWYHVNPVSRGITCEILKDMCLKTANSSLPTQTLDINSDHIKALELAKDFAKEKLSKFHYIEGITYVEFANEDNGKIVFHVYNPGSGMTDTIDWLTVDLEKNNITAMLNKELNTVTKVTYQKYKSTENNTEDNMASAKADGFYASEVVNSYSRFLEMALNDGVYKILNSFFSNPNAVLYNEKFLNNLRKKGAGFKVEKYKIIFDPIENYNSENNTYGIKVKYKITYTDNEDNPRNIEISNLFSVSEMRSGIKGEAKIVDMKNSEN